MNDVGFDKDVCVNGNRSVTAYWKPESRHAPPLVSGAADIASHSQCL